MHYEIDPDKSHLEELGGGLCREGFGRGYDKEEVSWKGALQHQVVTWYLRRQFPMLHVCQLHANRTYCKLHSQ